ncbi:MAG: symmetrical bis(5'-nucleosyl)-tetraphosphatase [Gammaproteobacteria bacterium]
MSVYVIGDVQGCAAELEALIDRIGFSPSRDRLVFVGDLVNRGPASAAVLRRVRALGASATAVLGNHDLHLVAVAAGCERARRRDTFQDVLDAPDREDMLHWLRRLPLLHREPGGEVVLHAGLPPQWNVDTAAVLAREVEQVLAGEGYRELARHMYDDRPRRWAPDLAGWARLRFIVNCLTRMRYCDRDGRLDLRAKGAPGTQPDGCMPWYEVPGRASTGTTFVFGHWSTLRLAAPECARHRVYPIDTGCVWGERLTALDLASRETISVPSRQPRVPEG